MVDFDGPIQSHGYPASSGKIYASQHELVRYLEAQWSSAERSNEEDSLEDDFEDDRLRSIFTCCHPSLPPEARVALTLREVCGLTTEEIAAFHTRVRWHSALCAPRQRFERHRFRTRCRCRRNCQRDWARAHVIYPSLTRVIRLRRERGNAAELTGEAIRLAGC